MNAFILTKNSYKPLAVKVESEAATGYGRRVTYVVTDIGWFNRRDLVPVGGKDNAVKKRLLQISERGLKYYTRLSKLAEEKNGAKEI